MVIADGFTGIVVAAETCGVGAVGLMLRIALRGTVVDPEMLAAGDGGLTGEGLRFLVDLVFFPFAML